MIRERNGKITLNKYDLNCITGVYEAFNSNIDYCVTLLYFGYKNHDELEGYLDNPSATFETGITREKIKEYLLRINENKEEYILDLEEAI